MSKANAGMNAIYNGGLAGMHGGMHGGGKGMDFLSKIHDFVKDKKLLSKAGDLAKQAGYGKRKAKSGGRRRRSRK